MRPRPPFIVFEGADGVGKSTQVRLLSERLGAAKVPFIVTREPGGTPAAEELRALLVTGGEDTWSPKAETLLMFAARAEHLRKTINPARQSGKVVICDRFTDSTRAYQGFAGALELEFIDGLNEAIVGQDGPDLVIVLDVDDAVRDDRLNARKGQIASTSEARVEEDRFERKGAAFSHRVREGFRTIAENNPDTHYLVDASGTIEAIADRIFSIVEPATSKWAEGA
ncbi:MAG: dTMP kinase [Pseudomonadota bacterium]